MAVPVLYYMEKRHEAAAARGAEARA
jgi:hypothetical protein